MWRGYAGVMKCFDSTSSSVVSFAEAMATEKNFGGKAERRCLRHKGREESNWCQDVLSIGGFIK